MAEAEGPRRQHKDQIGDLLMKSRVKSTCNWRAHMKEFMNADEAKELRQDRTIW